MELAIIIMLLAVVLALCACHDVATGQLRRPSTTQPSFSSRDAVIEGSLANGETSTSQPPITAISTDVVSLHDQATEKLRTEFPIDNRLTATFRQALTWIRQAEENRRQLSQLPEPLKAEYGRDLELMAKWLLGRILKIADMNRLAPQATLEMERYYEECSSEAVTLVEEAKYTGQALAKLLCENSRAQDLQQAREALVDLRYAVKKTIQDISAMEDPPKAHPVLPVFRVSRLPDGSFEGHQRPYTRHING